MSVSSSTPPNILLARAGLLPLARRREVEQAIFAFRFRHGSLPAHITDTLSHWTSKFVRSSSLRSSMSFRLPRARKSCLKQSPLYLSLSPSAHNCGILARTVRTVKMTVGKLERQLEVFNCPSKSCGAHCHHGHGPCMIDRSQYKSVTSRESNIE